MAMTDYRQMTDVGTNTTWEKKPIGALYSTMPRAIPEAAGVLARSMNTPEGISRVYDRAIAEKEVAWRGFDIRGANPRSPEGRALILERAQLYTAWNETEREKARAIAGWYRRRNEAAWAKSPDALIDVAVKDAEEFIWKNGFTKQIIQRTKLLVELLLILVRKRNSLRTLGVR